MNIVLIEATEKVENFTKVKTRLFYFLHTLKYTNNYGCLS